MTNRLSIKIPLFLVALTSLAQAQPAHDVCVPTAIGVPTRPGPPDWVSTEAGADTTLDDPRWNNATGNSFLSGAASPILQSRAVYTTVGGQEYLYLSLISALDPNSATPRDVFVGFNRVNPITPADPSLNEFAYIFQFHLIGPGSGDALALQYCGDYQSPDCAGETFDYWRVFVDRVGATDSNPQTCSAPGAGSSKGHQFTTWNYVDPSTHLGDHDRPPNTLGWFNSPCVAGQPCGSVAAWKLPGDMTNLFENRWAVQIRIPMTSTSTGTPAPISAGIEKGSRFWYEVTEHTSTANYVSLGHWPTELTTSICPNVGSPDYLIHAQLGQPQANVCDTCSLDNYSNLTTSIPNVLPEKCDGGFSIEPADIGAVFAAPGPASPPYSLTTNFLAYGSDGMTLGINTLIANVENTTAGSLTAPLMARFRLADWGTTVFQPGSTDIGMWHDVRGAEAGVCGAGTAPACTPITVLPTVPKPITFNWGLGSDTGAGGVGLSELCSFGITPHGGSCPSCTCAATADAGTEGIGCINGQPAVHAASEPTTCLFQHATHECMYVELSSPGGQAQFVHSSAFNNMNFGTMSTFERDATIDVAGLPKPAHGDKQDMIFMLMPRNMPAKLPAATTGAKLIATATLAAAKKVSDSYQPYVGKLSDADVAAQVKKLKRTPMDPVAVKASKPSKEFGEGTILQIEKTRQLMTAVDSARTGAMLDVAAAASEASHDPEATEPKPTTTLAADLTKKVVSSLGPVAAAGVVPTLEVYPFYLPGNVGKTYQPMPSFAVFLSHEGKLDGMHYSIEGATKIAENVYKMQVPVGKTDKIHIRASTEELKAPEPPPTHHEPTTPPPKKKSGCGCETTNGSTSGWLLAGLVAFAIRRRRNRRHS